MINMITVDWSCPKKTLARQRTILAPYRDLFGHSIPEGREYWTLSGLCADPDGSLRAGCELHQLSEAGLITPDQFHAVESDLGVYKRNRKIQGSHWYHGDIYEVMRSRPVNPAIVNLDLIEFPKQGSKLIGDVLLLLTEQGVEDVLVVANFVLKAWCLETTSDSILESLHTRPAFCTAYPQGWQTVPACYVYSGTGESSKTRMGTMAFWR